MDLGTRGREGKSGTAESRQSHLAAGSRLNKLLISLQQKVLSRPWLHVSFIAESPGGLGMWWMFFVSSNAQRASQDHVLFVAGPNKLDQYSRQQACLASDVMFVRHLDIGPQCRRSLSKGSKGCTDTRPETPPAVVEK